MDQLSLSSSEALSEGRRGSSPVAHHAVTIEDTFWAPRLQTLRDRTLFHIYEQMEQKGYFVGYKHDWQPEKGRIPFLFWESDITKWLEAASYSLAVHPDPALEALVDKTITFLASFQQPDGYLNIWFTAVEPEKRWTNLRDWHELYCAGHLIEGAVAHFQATGEARYLNLARYFVEERGQNGPPHYFDSEARARGEDPADFWARSYEYNQSHVPIREQHEVVGHAVRAMYLYSALTDLTRELDDESWLAVCEGFWRHLSSKRMYITGGIGPSADNEGFTADYDLPN